MNAADTLNVRAGQETRQETGNRKQESGLGVIFLLLFFSLDMFSDPKRQKNYVFKRFSLHETEQEAKLASLFTGRKLVSAYFCPRDANWWTDANACYCAAIDIS